MRRGYYRPDDSRAAYNRLVVDQMYEEKRDYFLALQLLKPVQIRALMRRA